MESFQLQLLSCEISYKAQQTKKSSISILRTKQCIKRHDILTHFGRSCSSDEVEVYPSCSDKDNKTSPFPATGKLVLTGKGGMTEFQCVLIPTS